jgi:hypothetical protein
LLILSLTVPLLCEFLFGCLLLLAHHGQGGRDKIGRAAARKQEKKKKNNKTPSSFPRNHHTSLARVDDDVMRAARRVEKLLREFQVIYTSALHVTTQLLPLSRSAARMGMDLHSFSGENLDGDLCWLMAGNFRLPTDTEKLDTFFSIKGSSSTIWQQQWNK